MCVNGEGLRTQATTCFSWTVTLGMKMYYSSAIINQRFATVAEKTQIFHITVQTGMGAECRTITGKKKSENTCHLKHRNPRQFYKQGLWSHLDRPRNNLTEHSWKQTKLRTE